MRHRHEAICGQGPGRGRPGRQEPRAGHCAGRLDFAGARRPSRTGLSLGQIAQQVKLSRSDCAAYCRGAGRREIPDRGLTECPGSPWPDHLASCRLGAHRLCARAHGHFSSSLVHELKETVDLAARSTAIILVFVDQVIGSHRLRAVSAVGEAFPLYCTANGKAYLAELDAAGVERLIGTNYEQRTPRTITRLR